MGILLFITFLICCIVLYKIVFAEPSDKEFKRMRANSEKELERLKEKERKKLEKIEAASPKKQKPIKAKRTDGKTTGPFILTNPHNGQTEFYNQYGYRISGDQYWIQLHEELDKQYGNWVDISDEEYYGDDIDRWAQDVINEENGLKEIEFLKTLSNVETKELNVYLLQPCINPNYIQELFLRIKLNQTQLKLSIDGNDKEKLIKIAALDKENAVLQRKFLEHANEEEKKMLNDFLFPNGRVTLQKLLKKT